MSFVGFPKIGQFNQAVRHVADRTRYRGRDDNGEPIFDAELPLPKLKLRGTVKVHGTNAGIRRESGKFICQSRERDLPFPQDNYGFRTWVDKFLSEEDNCILKLFADVERIATLQSVDFVDKQVTVFGEWAGNGVQTTVSVSEVGRFFYVFAAKVDEVWLDISDLAEFPEERIFNCERMKQWELEIDFNDRLDLAKASEFMRNLTLEVEQLCPVGVALKNPKKEYKNTTGEGVVYKAVDPAWSDLIFKVKGEEHSHSKVRTIAAVDVEKVENAIKFTEYAVTENRLLRGVEALKEAGKEVSKKSTGDFVAWLCRDCITEEADTMKASGLDGKIVGNHIGTRAREWFFAYLEKL